MYLSQPNWRARQDYAQAAPVFCHCRRVITDMHTKIKTGVGTFTGATVSGGNQRLDIGGRRPRRNDQMRFLQQQSELRDEIDQVLHIIG